MLSENHTLKRALADPRLFSGIGNAYSDEILHRARLSPLQLTSRLQPEEIVRLYARRARLCCSSGPTDCAGDREPTFPEKVTAFREGMAVHGRYRRTLSGLRHARATDPLRRQRNELLPHLPDRWKASGRPGTLASLASRTGRAAWTKWRSDWRDDGNRDARLEAPVLGLRGASPIREDFRRSVLTVGSRGSFGIPTRRLSLTDRAETHRGAGMWRFRKFLPLSDGEEPITLGEGDTPLLEIKRTARALGFSDLWLKDEGANPTGSFKARGMAMAVTRAVPGGAQAFVVPTAGNAGVALAAYAARAGLPARIYAPASTPPTILAQIRRFGAELELLEGHIGDCGAAATEFASRTGAFPDVHAPRAIPDRRQEDIGPRARATTGAGSFRTWSSIRLEVGLVSSECGSPSRS